ncbi:MAG: restriction endonuclease [Proteobacteria bacterium]|nr:restriction endonuclease [Pseudomonadota bacterium]
MPIPDYQSLMLPVLTIAAQGETRAAVVAQAIGDQLGLSDEERLEMLPSGKQSVLINRIHWAKFYMSKAGLIDVPKRGVFVASASGRALLATKPLRIDVELLKSFPSFAEFYRQASEREEVAVSQAVSSIAALDATPEEQIEIAQSTLAAALKAELLQRVLEQSPTFFEGLIVDLLVAMGYGGSHEDAARQLGKSGDGGVDGVIDEDRLGLDRIYVQAKHYTAGSVGRPEVQGFVGSLVGLGANKGVFVTTSGFSKQALDYVRGLQQRVILIDGARLTELMMEYGVGVRTSRVIEVKRLDEDFFSDGF